MRCVYVALLLLMFILRDLVVYLFTACQRTVLPDSPLLQLDTMQVHNDRSCRPRRTVLLYRVAVARTQG
ncbi:hypothetical protein K440DRAFT_615678 [Wilcoxina mikolae CBS 423.85]|nr:hypothetical protein K440DRAFT_615678 [Wilcoxina mikolae CBS 423.85]